MVGRVRRLARTRRVGHAGTLDPMATGVLVLGLNRATKLLTFLVGCDKTYEATIRLGQSTVTDDADGPVTASADASGLSSADIGTAIAALTGDIEQVPSSVSAIKVDGQRAYARVRGGDEVKLAARPVRVSSFDVLARRDVGQCVDLDVRVAVSSGTYVRALARDLGAALGVGGHLTALRRTTVGRFTLDVATPLESLLPDALPVIAMAQAAREQFAVRSLSAEEARTVRFGQKLAAGDPVGDPIAAIGPGDDLVAMLDQSGAAPRSHVVFPPR